MNWSARVKDLSLIGLSALLLILAFPKFDFSFLAWVALVPLLFALERKGLGETFLLGYLAGLLSFSGIFVWIWSVEGFTALDFVLLAIYLPQYVSVWAIGVWWLRRSTGLPSTLIAPPLWVTLEYVRAHFFFLSCPCNLLGHSQYLQHDLVQITAFTGTYGLSFFIVLVNVTFVQMLLHMRTLSPRRSTTCQPTRLPTGAMIACLVILVASVGYGEVILGEGRTPGRIKVAAIQGNTSQYDQWEPRHRDAIIAKYARLTRDAARHAPGLIIWPESAVPGDVLHREFLQNTLGRLAREVNTSLLVGSAEEGKFEKEQLLGKYYNALVLISPKGEIEDEYRKIGLVPFGEYVPLKGIVEWPDFVASNMGNLLPGEKHTVFQIDDVTFSGMICWEVMFPELFREFVKKGAGFIVNATNEVWFGKTALSYQYLAMTAMLGAQNRVATVRVGNSGVTAFIDEFGRITKRLKDQAGEELFIEGILVGDMPVTPGGTFYTHYGDLFAFLQILVSIGFGLSGALCSRSSGPASDVALA